MKRKTIRLLIAFFSLTYALSSYAGDIYCHLLTTGNSSHYLGDSVNYTINWEVGQTSWNATDTGYGTSNTDPSGWSWTVASYYEDGSGDNKRVRSTITMPQTVGVYYYAGRAKADSGDPWHYANYETWENTTTFSPDYSITVNALENPTALSSSANSWQEISLSWTLWNSKDVIVIRKAGSAPGSDPTGGTTYAVGDAVGDAKVVYKGSATSFSDQELKANTHYYYKIYSDNNSYYSSGESSDTTTKEYQSGVIVDHFEYTIGNDLNSKNGSNNWAGAWSSSAGEFTISAGSFDNLTGYPDNAGNKVVVTPASSDARTAVRTITAISSGKIYFSYILNYANNNAQQWCGLSLMNSSTEEALIGEASGPQKYLTINVDGTEYVSSYELSNGSGNDYCIIGMYDYDTDTIKAKGFYINTQSVPSTEPTTWDVEQALSGGKEISSVNGIRMGAGGLNSPGSCYFDHIRVATSWERLLNLAPATQASDLGADSTQDTGAEISWTDGNGQGRLILAQQAESQPASSDPTDGVTYSAAITVIIHIQAVLLMTGKLCITVLLLLLVLMICQQIRNIT